MSLNVRRTRLNAVPSVSSADDPIAMEATLAPSPKRSASSSRRSTGVDDEGAPFVVTRKTPEDAVAVGGEQASASVQHQLDVLSQQLRVIAEAMPAATVTRTMSQRSAGTPQHRQRQLAATGSAQGASGGGGAVGLLTTSQSSSEVPRHTAASVPAPESQQQQQREAPPLAGSTTVGITVIPGSTATTPEVAAASPVIPGSSNFPSGRAASNSPGQQAAGAPNPLRFPGGKDFDLMSSQTGGEQKKRRWQPSEPGQGAHVLAQRSGTSEAHGAALLGQGTAAGIVTARRRGSTASALPSKPSFMHIQRTTSNTSGTVGGGHDSFAGIERGEEVRSTKSGLRGQSVAPSGGLVAFDHTAIEVNDPNGGGGSSPRRRVLQGSGGAGSPLAQTMRRGGGSAGQQFDEGDVGLSEDTRFVAVMDIVFILSAIACSILSISGVNPRFEVEHSPRFQIAAVVFFAFSTAFNGAWMAMRFFVQSRRGDWEIIDRLTDIRQRYLRTWFAFDFLMWVPIEWVFVYWHWQVFFIIGMKNLIRIVRIVSLGSSGNPLRGARLWYRFLSFCVAYALIIHTLASIFGVVEDRGYIESLYWTVLTVTSVGYGDVVPKSDGGRIFAICAMITGVLLISSLTAFATSVLTSRNKLEADIEERKSLMDAMLTYYDVPWEVRRDVIQMFPSVLEAQSESTFRNMNEAMPVFVSRKVDAYARAKLLRNVPIFRNEAGTEFVLALSQLMTRRFVPVGEYIINVGDVGTEMFFIIRGVVEVLIPAPEDPEEEIVVASLRAGEFFGEIALIEDVVRTASVQAATLCELFVLDREHLSGQHLTHLEELVHKEMARRQQTAEELMKHNGSPPRPQAPGAPEGANPFSGAVFESGSFTNSAAGEHPTLDGSTSGHAARLVRGSSGVRGDGVPAGSQNNSPVTFREQQHPFNVDAGPRIPSNAGDDRPALGSASCPSTVVPPAIGGGGGGGGPLRTSSSRRDATQSSDSPVEPTPDTAVVAPPA